MNYYVGKIPPLISELAALQHLQKWCIFCKHTKVFIFTGSSSFLQVSINNNSISEVFEFKSNFATDCGVSWHWASEERSQWTLYGWNVVNTQAPSFSIWSSSFFQQTRTCLKARMTKQLSTVSIQRAYHCLMLWTFLCLQFWLDLLYSSR